jgi:hypothetical protein
MASRFKNKEFKFPVTSLIGSSYQNLNQIFDGRDTQGFKKRYHLTKGVGWILEWFRLMEEKKYGKVIESQKIEKPPIFIIGFWRSGTTILHNLMCQNPDFAFVNTFQAVFPGHCLLNQGWLRRAASLLVPENRPGDNVKFNFKYPQEEEIALGNMQPLSFYNFFYFPQDTEEFIDKSLLFKDISDEEFELWKQAYHTLIQTALINTNGKQFISKNPPNTFRIPQLLEMFPDARFIYIQRDLHETLYSFLRFTAAVREGIKHQSYDRTKQELILVRLYKLLRDKYEKDKVLIPDGQLVEIDFSYFEQNMIEEIKRVYQVLGLEGIDKAVPLMESYLDDLGEYKRSKHQFDDDFLELVERELGAYIEK